MTLPQAPPKVVLSSQPGDPPLAGAPAVHGPLVHPRGGAHAAAAAGLVLNKGRAGDVEVLLERTVEGLTWGLRELEFWGSEQKER